ncbi:MAG: putative sulfate exporter family transporter [Desulfobulbus sp.]|nr:putative sulfate exporter family transporter [Desulfobulbus sp.]
MTTSSSFAALRRRVPGVLLTFALALAAIGLAQTGWAERWGLTALTLAIVLGMALGNLAPGPLRQWRCEQGVDWSRQRLLRLGIILFGLRLTFQDMARVGWAGVAIDALMICSTFALALLIGRRWLRLDEPTVVLIGAGSSICGAAAVLAAQPVAKGSAEQVSVAVATVVVFGTLAMFGYPLLHAGFGLSDAAFGIYTGSTVHEVAQVVVAARAVSEQAADLAVIAKMIRVMMLAPFLLLVSALLAARGQDAADARAWQQRLVVPWFAFGFVLMAGVRSSGWAPDALLGPLLQLDNLLLAMAMAALGLGTHASSIARAGVRPLLLAALLTLWLVAGGALVNGLVQGWWR